MGATNIGYTDEVSNPLFAKLKGDSNSKMGTFCEKPDPEGSCKNCWAEKLNGRFQNNKLAFDRANRDKIEWVYKEKPMKRLQSLNADQRQSSRNPGNPLMVFACDTFDLFQPSISDALRNKIFDEYDKFTNLTIQIQTTYPARMNHYLNARYGADVPGHYWFGMSAGDQEFLDKNIDYLTGINSSVRYLIFEPILSKVKAPLYYCCNCMAFTKTEKVNNDKDWGCMICGCYKTGGWKPASARGIDQVIIGGESGAGARPAELDWFQEMVIDCQAARIPVFVKQLGANLRRAKCLDCADQSGICSMDGISCAGIKDRKGGNILEFPKELRFRQFPKLKS